MGLLEILRMEPQAMYVIFSLSGHPICQWKRWKVPISNRHDTNEVRQLLEGENDQILSRITEL